jgi:hypothetical protein
VVVADVEVWIALNATTNVSTTSNATGYYEFVDLAEGTYTVSVNDTFYYAGDEADFVVEKGTTLIDANMTIGYYALSQINGTVLDEYGAPLEGVSLVLVENGDFTAETDVNGSYLIEGVPVGSYLLNATLDGYYFSVEFADVVAGGVTVNFTLEEYKAGIFGWVYYEEDVFNATANATVTEMVFVADAIMTLEDTDFETTTDADGYYEFLDLPLGNYKVIANASGWVDIKSANIVANDVDTLYEVNLTFNEKFIPEVAYIVGWVLDEDGAGVNNTEVVIEWSETIVNQTVNATNVTVWNNVTNYVWFNATTNETGYYTSLVPLPLMLFSVRVTVPAGYDAVTPVAVNLSGKAKLSQTVANFTLVKTVVPPSKFALTITVVPKDATVKVDGSAVTVNATTGVVVVPDLAIGNHTVEVSKAGYVTQTKTIAILDKDEAVTITLVAVVYPITLTILGADGKPLAEASVSFEYGGKTWTGTTDANGTVTIAGFPVAAIPAGINVTVTDKDGNKEIISSDKLTGGKFTMVNLGEEEEDDSSALLWIILAIVLVLIIVVVVIIIMKGKKKEEVPPELKESGEVPEEGAEAGEKKEGEELAEGETLAEDKEAVEEGAEKEGDFKADETAEETEGVEEGADEMEDFEDEPDEDLDEDVGENYEDELDEEEEEK